jgi:membrane protein
LVIGFVLVATVCIVALPVALNYLPGFMGFILNIVRWPVLLVLVAVALAVIYRYGPSRDEPKWRWITWGSALAALAWLGFSAIFSFYAAHFGSFNKTYGSLGAIIGFMTWMWLSVAVILLGAKLNAETEHQTARDSTEGSPKPLGARAQKWPIRLGRVGRELNQRPPPWNPPVLDVTHEAFSSPGHLTQRIATPLIGSSNDGRFVYG